MKTHINAKGRGLYKPDNAECGTDADIKNITTNARRVTCQRCLKTQTCRNAMKTDGARK